MARFVVFNGIVRYKPGGITKINAEALNQVALSDNSIVALIGEADGGAPGSVDGIETLFSPDKATELYRSGPLADAIRLAFQSSGDNRIVGGASRVLIYKTNNSTQASISLPRANAETVVDSTATDGSTTTIEDTVALAPGTYADDELIGMHVVLRPYTANAEVRPITDYDNATSTLTVGTAFSTTAAAADEYMIIEDEVYLASVMSGGGTTLTVANGGMTADEHIGRWVYLRTGSGASDYVLARITDNDTTTLTLSAAVPTLPTGAWGQILGNAVDLTSKDYGAHTNGITADIADGNAAGSKISTVEFEGESQSSPEIGGVPFFKLLYRGGGDAVSDTVAASPASTATVIELTTGGLTPSAHVGQQVLINGEYTTITANTASQLTVSPALSAAPAAADSVAIRNLTGGTAEVVGSAGEATSLVATLSGVTGDDLSETFTAGMTLRQLADTINANPNYLAVIPNGINPDLSLAEDFDFGPGTSISVLNSADLTDDGFHQDNVALVNYYDERSSYVSAVRSSGGAYDGGVAPGELDEAISLVGGSRGVSSNTDFQSAMDALLLVRANSVVPLIDEDLAAEGYGSTATVASVAAQLSAHVAVARGAGNSERGGFIGFQGTKDEIIDQANAINDPDVQLTCQNPTVLNASGSLQEFGPRMLAVMGASMRAGVPEVGEPLTHKYLRVSGLTQDASWDPADLTDSTELIQAGVFFAETIDGKGTRWVRDLTTHVKDDNLAFSEGSVRDAVRFIAFGLRELLVDRYTGRKAAPATIASIKDTASTYLELARADNIIVDSNDPATGATVRAYHNLKVSSSGDTVTVNVGIFPVPGINFILNEIFLQLPTQSA